jgi:hypothetical protein
LQIEEKAHLRIAFLLQVSNDALTNQVRSANDVQDFLIVVADQSQLEAVLGWIDDDSARLGIAVKAVDGLALDPSQIDGLLQRLDDAVVTLRQSVFDVVQGGVDKDAAVVPSP